MNKFVNFGKRSVELPAGCKDLIDVLQRADTRPAPTLTTSSVEGLTGVVQYLSRLAERGPKTKNLTITWHELNYVHLANEQGAVTAQMVIHENNHREQAVREVFEAAGLKAIRDEAVAGYSVRVLGYPLEGGASGVREVIFELLRRGFGLSENVRLEIGAWEDDTS